MGSDDGARTAMPALRVAYVMSRFPKLTETFVLNELLAVERLGVAVDVYPLQRERGDVLQPGAAEVVERARYVPILSPAILGSHLRFLGRQPRVYLATLAHVLRGTFRSRRLFGGAVLFFPKIVHVARLMEADGVDHVHCHFATHPALVGFVVHRLTGIPYSFTAHGSDIHIDRTMLAEKVREAAFVVPISRANADVIAGEAGPDVGASLEVIHCGVDTRIFTPNPAGRDDGPPFRIAAVGTLHEVKGQRYLIEACAILVEGGLDVRCELIGNGPDEAPLRALVSRLGLGDRVTFTGQLRQDEVITRLRAAHVLAAPSVPTRQGRREGIPVVLMEAMATGLPVVASRLSGIPELVEDGRSGFLVPPGDSRALADALRRLLLEPGARSRMGEAARAVVESEFNLERSARRLVERFAESARGGAA